MKPMRTNTMREAPTVIAAQKQVVVIGGGFGGLAAAIRL